MTDASGKQLEAIKLEFLKQAYLHMDETGSRICVLGRTGCAWVAVVPGAIRVHFAPVRGAAVLREHFGRPLGKAAAGCMCTQRVLAWAGMPGVHVAQSEAA